MDEKVASTGVLEPAEAVRAVRPMVSIRGLLGSELVDRDSGLIVWGSTLLRVASPRKTVGLVAASHPMGLGVPLCELTDRVEATRSIPGFRFGIPLTDHTKSAQRLARSEKAKGRGAIAERRSTFVYDWRRELSEHAADLHRHVLERSESSGSDRVDVIAHSLGGFLLRYYLRFGPEPLPDDGSVPEITWAGARHVRHAVVMGTPAGGAIPAVTMLASGARVVPIFGGRYPASMLGTIASVYHLLPRGMDGRVRDLRTEEAIDLFDLATWERYRLGLMHRDGPRFFEAVMPGETTERREEIARDHLSKCLSRAEQFHRAIDTPVPLPEGTDLHIVAGQSERTPEVLGIDPRTGNTRVIEFAEGDSVVSRSAALRRYGEGEDVIDPASGEVSSVRTVETPHRSMPGDVALARRIGRMLRD